ncbi:MAG: carboxypeptidase-like regulatory domain-containing protein [Terracidiphilus sp.]
MTIAIESVTIVRMTIKRFSLIAISLCAFMPLAHAQATATLTVIVQDLTGSRVPGARITATDEATGTPFDTTTDPTGQAAVQLIQGNYELKVRAKGFASWTERDVSVNAETKRTVTLNIAQECSHCVSIEGNPQIPLEHQILVAEIPLIPAQQLTLPARSPRHRRRWL